MHIRRALSYDDVLLEPITTFIKSRWDCNTHSTLHLNNRPMWRANPLIASPMSTVCDIDMCVELNKHACFGILHRGHPYIDTNITVNAIRKIINSGVTLFGVAIGSQDKDYETATRYIDEGVAMLCVDVANGHNVHVAKFVERLKLGVAKNIHVMTGNIATWEGFQLLADSGADSVRAGIGGGGACSTRGTTGIGVPTLQTILDCAEWRAGKTQYYSTIDIIADGGCKSAGDIVKALAAGADFVMCGSLLAGTSKSPGKLQWLNKLTNETTDVQPLKKTIISTGTRTADEILVPDTSAVCVKKYEGMASFNVQVDQGRDESKIVPEGVSTFVKYTGETSETIKLLLGGLRSAMSYCNAETLDELRKNAQFIEITSGGLHESQPHAMYRL